MPTRRKFLLFALLLMASAVLFFFYGFIAVPEGVGTAGFVVLCFSLTLICATPLRWSMNKGVIIVLAMVSAENAIFAVHTAWLADKEYNEVFVVAMFACVISLIVLYLSIYRLRHWPKPPPPGFWNY